VEAGSIPSLGRDHVREGTFEERAAAWDDAVRGVKAPGDDNSLDVAIDALQRQLDRAIAGIKVNDDKAGLVIPAVGVLAAVVGSNVRPDISAHQVLAVVGLGAALGALGAILCALIALNPKSLSNGPVALRAVKGVAAPARAGKLNYLKSLGFAVQESEDVILKKAFWVQWGFRIGAVGVLLTVFAAGGGFASGGTPT
jgi:hypothetical protein